MTTANEGKLPDEPTLAVELSHSDRVSMLKALKLGATSLEFGLREALTLGAGVLMPFLSQYLGFPDPVGYVAVVVLLSWLVVYRASRFTSSKTGLLVLAIVVSIAGAVVAVLAPSPLPSTNASRSSLPAAASSIVQESKDCSVNIVGSNNKTDVKCPEKK